MHLVELVNVHIIIPKQLILGLNKKVHVTMPTERQHDSAVQIYNLCIR